MRIHPWAPWAPWVLLGAMSSIVAAQEKQSPFLFDGVTFGGEMFPDHQSSIFQYQNMSDGKVFKWTWTSDRVKVFRVDLMNTDNESMLFWCPDRQDCTTTEGFDVVGLDTAVPEIRLSPDVVKTLQPFFGKRLFFRVDWQATGKRRQEQQSSSSYSQEWGIVDDDTNAAGAMYSSFSSQMTAGASDYQSPGPTPTTITTASDAGSATTSATSIPTTSSAAATTTTTTTTTTTANSGNRSGGLTTGAIVGIVVGAVGGLILVSVVAGCFCLRRGRDTGAERGGSRGVQDIIADKEAHTSILDRDQPDTPYSEQNSQNPLHRGLGLAGRNESGVELGIGQAMSGDGRGSVRTESLHTVVAGGNDRNSAVYSSLGGAANSAHGTPVMGSGAFASSPPTHTHTPSMSVHDRSSAMGSPVLRASSQLERSLSPYRDNAGQHEYSQHHHVIDGADLVQQEHSNDSITVRSPSSIYSSNPLEELQPTSPESPREGGGAVPGGGGASAHGPPGHGRSNTPSGISGQYAHLVEEGMTDDEIRRLEEEERVLDEAIEQAGTAGRKR